MDPTFVLDHPLSESPLAKEHREKPFLAERFELFVGGCELVNAYTEQNDPDAQREAFRRQSVRYNYSSATTALYENFNLKDYHVACPITNLYNKPGASVCPDR